MSQSKKCAKILKSGEPCSRDAQLNSNYCWQHQNELIPKYPKPYNKKSLRGKEDLPGELLNEIFSFAGRRPALNKDLPAIINRDRILSQWLEDIRVKTPYDQIIEKEKDILMILYQNRVDNAPARNLLYQAITEKKIDPYLFYSKTFDYLGQMPNDLIIELEDRDYLDQTLTNAEDELTTLLQSFISEQKVREGDIIYMNEIEEGSGFYYNGTSLVWLNYKRTAFGWEHPQLPEEVNINDFPIVDYFEKTSLYLDYLHFNTTDTEFKLVTTDKDQFWEYKTSGNYKNFRLIITELQDNLQFLENIQSDESHITVSNILPKFLENDQSMRILIFN
jgi:hypothetical protein